MVDRRRKLHRELAASLPGALGALAAPVIPAASVVELMGVHREPLVVRRPSDPASRAYAELWRGRGPPGVARVMEVERKFLVAEVPDLSGVPRTAIRQGYVAVAEGGDEVRVRDRDGACTLTVKHGSGMVREEAEVSISAILFAELWALTDGRGSRRSATSSRSTARPRSSTSSGARSTAW